VASALTSRKFFNSGPRVFKPGHVICRSPSVSWLLRLAQSVFNFWQAWFRKWDVYVKPGEPECRQTVVNGIVTIH